MCWGLYTDNDRLAYLGTPRVLAKMMGVTENSLRINISYLVRNIRRTSKGYEKVEGLHNRLCINNKYYNIYPLWYEDLHGEIVEEIERDGKETLGEMLR